MPAATGKLVRGVAPPSKKRKLTGRNAPKPSTATVQPELHDARNGSEPKLPKPLGANSRRILSQETSKLIRKRNELDRALLVQAFRPLDELSANDWLPREELLRQCELMVFRERDYIRTRTKMLEERTAIYNQDPSEERALDLDRIRTELCKFKRHLGPYLKSAQEPRGADKETKSSADTDSDPSGEEAELVRGKTDGSGPCQSSQGKAANGHTHERSPSVGLDGAFDDIGNSRKRNGNDLDERKEPRKKARKEQASGSTQATTSQRQSVKDGAPARSKEMETSLAQIYNSMSQTKSSQVSINDDSKVEVEKTPVGTTTKGATEKADRKAPNTSASSSSNSVGDGAVRPFYQRHAKAMIRPDFDDLVYDRPQRRCGPKSKQKRRDYLVSGALPVPHLPSPRPDKHKARSASTDGP